eukprot:432249-Ditylum_brightwellii.AAC.1
MKRILGNLFEQDIDAEIWVSALREGKVNLVSDRSVLHGKGTFAVIFKSAEREIHFQGLADCYPSLIQSYCAELTGILAIYYLLKCFKQYGSLDQSSEVIAHVDIISVVSMTNLDKEYPGVSSHTSSDIDILQ